ncbi:MAG: hypothetical protein NTW21_38070 [Verrucomicrobia bacterium]|nr:hypothetical protein [Verrucomicrobiota bacterium]
MKAGILWEMKEVARMGKELLMARMRRMRIFSPVLGLAAVRPPTLRT